MIFYFSWFLSYDGKTQTTPAPVLSILKDKAAHLMELLSESMKHNKPFVGSKRGVISVTGITREHFWCQEVCQIIEHRIWP